MYLSFAGLSVPVGDCSFRLCPVDREVAVRNSPSNLVPQLKLSSSSCHIVVAVAQNDSPEFRKQSEEYYKVSATDKSVNAILVTVWRWSFVLFRILACNWRYTKERKERRDSGMACQILRLSWLHYKRLGCPFWREIKFDFLCVCNFQVSAWMFLMVVHSSPFPFHFLSLALFFWPFFSLLSLLSSQRLWRQRDWM